ncbi:MAG: hypothetical protein AUJ23_01840 [Candidatus Magasanikbacteria bacterium CG1_02_32_51]|nr:MAG: hypothetical protein AUJ23_01840 [Candidatus Magasanikbacteria bacterium CG1_02_32_51]
MHKYLDKWLEALHSDEPNVIAALYADDATFLPTMSGDLKRGVSGALEYFQEDFMPSSPRGIIRELVVQEFGEEIVLLAGFYDFSTHDGQLVVEARFTFLAKRMAEDEWKIVHHHSSYKPVSKN